MFGFVSWSWSIPASAGNRNNIWRLAKIVNDGTQGGPHDQKENEHTCPQTGDQLCDCVSCG